MYSFYRYQECIGNGNKEVGDGKKYRGRGLLQLTWKCNYESLKEELNIDCVTNYDKLSADINLACISAAHYWRNISSWGDLNNFAEKDDFLKVCIGINGGFRHLDIRYNKTHYCIDKFGCKECTKFSDLALGDYSLESSSLNKSNLYKEITTGTSAQIAEREKKRNNLKQAIKNAKNNYKKNK